MSTELVTVGSFIHANKNCALLKDVPLEDLETFESNTNVLECVCLTASKALKKNVRHEALYEILYALKSQLIKGEVDARYTLQAMAGLHLNPEFEQADELVKIIEDCRQLLKGTNEIPKLKRKIIQEAILGQKCASGLYAISEALNEALMSFNLSSEITFKGNQEIATWCRVWQETGDYTKARQAFLNLPGAWNTLDKINGMKKELPNSDGLATRGAWKIISDLLEQGTKQMERALNDSGESILMLGDWTRFADSTTGNHELCYTAASYENYIQNEVMAVKAPAWLLEHLENAHQSEHYQNFEVSHLIVLPDPNTLWKNSVETMLSIWNKSGVSFEFKLDAYGQRVQTEDTSDYHVAWESAKTLEEK